MAIELEKLLFSVDTGQLKDALDKIDAISSSVSKLASATDKLNKVTEDEVKTKKNKTKAAEEAAKAEETLAENTKQSTTVLERQKDILKFQTEGFSKGQSSVLAYAKATGAATSEIKELGNVLQMQRKLIGGDPFDKSISGLVALQNQYGEIREAMRQYSKDTELTRNQTRELTRDKERIIEKMKLEGATFSEIKNAIRAHNDEYVRTAALVNSLVVQERNLERAQKDKLNALRAIQAAEERTTATLHALNMETEGGTKLNERAALAIGSYERNLRVAGLSADEAAKRLKNFKEQQVEVTKATQRNQLDYLARGVGVQLGDIGVSLASGMNPLIVAVQQGDQLRAIIQQVGPDAKDMENVMSTALAQIASSFALMGKAVSSFVVGAIKSLGEFVTTFTFVDKTIEFVANKSGMNLDKLKTTINVLTGALVTGPIVAFGAFIIASKQMLDANNALDRSLAQFGATLGITSKEAHALAQSQTELGVTSATATNTLADFAKSGITDVGMLEAALQSAIKTQKILGISTEDTAKVFADLRKKPTETLIEIAKNTGLVNAETIKYVHTLEEQGKTQEAVAIAQGANLAAMEGVRQVADVNLTEVEKLWRDIKNAVNEVWGAMQNLSQNTDFWKGVRDLFAKLKLIAVQTMNVIGGIGLAIRDLLSFDFDSDRINGFINEQNQKAADEYEATMRNIYNATAQNTEAEKKSAKARQENSIAASKLAEQFKKDKENKAKADKEAERILKEYNKDIDEFAKLIAEAYGEQERLTKSEMKMMEIIRSDYWNKYTEKQKIAILQAYDLAKATELATDKIKAQADSMRAWAEVTKELQQQNAEMQKRSEVIDNEVQLLGLVGVEREKVLRQIELQNKYAAAQERFDKNQINIIKKYREEQEKASKLTSEENRDALYAQNAAAYEDAMKQAEELLNKERDVANKEVNKSIAESYYKEMQRVSDMLADVLITALTEGGKAGSKKLGDYIKKELLSASSMFISSIIRAQLGNFMQSAFGVNAGNYPGGTLAGNLAGAASSAYNTFTGGQGLAGSLYSSFAMSGVGQSLGLSSTVGLSGIPGMGVGVGGAIPEVAMTSLGSSIGAAIPYIGLGLTAMSLLSSSGMFSSGGAPKVDTFMGGRLTPSGASLDTSGWNVWNADKQNTQAASALINEEFAKVIRKINPEYFATAFISGHLNIKGRSSNQQVAEIRNKQEQAIYSVFKEEGKGTADFEKFVQEQIPKMQFALIVDAMRTASEDYKEIANIIVGDSENLTEALKGVSQEGIAAMQASLSSAMQAFEIAGNIFDEIGVKISGQEFKKASESVGSFENLSTLLLGYYDKFYTEEEKRVRTMQGLVEELSKVGLNVSLDDALKATNQDFRNLYESIVKTKGFADPTAIALLQVSSAFAEVAAEAEVAADVIEETFDYAKNVLDATADAMTRAFKDLERSTEAEVKSLQNKKKEIENSLKLENERLSSLKKVQSEFSDLFDFLEETIKELRGSVQSTNAMLVKDAQKVLENVLSTGAIPDSAVIKEAVSTLKQNVTDSIFVSKVDQDRVTIKLSNTMASVADITKKQLSETDKFVLAQENLIKSLEDQKSSIDSMVTALNEQLDFYRNQMQSAKEGYAEGTLLSIEQAIKNMQAAIVNAIAAQTASLNSVFSSLQAGKISTSTASTAVADITKNPVPLEAAFKAGDYTAYASSGGAIGSIETSKLKPETLGSEVKIATNAGWVGTLDEAKSIITDAFTTMQPAEFANAAKKQGLSAKTLQAMYGFSDSELNNWLRVNNLQSFDVGTNYVPYDMTANIHKGERIIPAADNTRLMQAIDFNLGNSEALADEIKALRQEVQMLRHEARSTAVNTSKMAKQLDRTSDQGDTLRVTVVA